MASDATASPKSFSELLAFARAGSEGAFSELAERLRPGLMTLARQYLHGCTEADCLRISSLVIDQIRQNLSKIHSSPVSYARAIMLNELCNDLMPSVRRDDSRAWNSLFTLLRSKVFEDPQFSSAISSKQLDEDVLQDASLVLMSKLKEHVESNPYLYFKQIIINKLLDKARSGRVAQFRFKNLFGSPSASSRGDEEERSIEDVLPAEDDIEREIETRDVLDRILKAIELLPAFCQDFFKTLYQSADEKSWRQAVREKWEMTESALNTRIHRCRHNLQAVLKESGVTK